MEDIREKAIKILTETSVRTSILDDPNIDYTEAYKDGQIVMQYITKWWFTNAKEIKICNLPRKYIEKYKIIRIQEIGFCFVNRQ